MASDGTGAARVPGTPSAAWIDSGHAWVGWGVAQERVATSFEAALALAAELATSGEGHWFGGLAFPTARNTGKWAGFPAARFIRPERVERLSSPSDAGARTSPGAAPERFASAEGERLSWGENVDRATAAIAAHRFEKVVLARELECVAGSPVDAWRVFRALCSTASASRHFFFRSGEGCFIGATPETLVRWHDGRLELDALAGSAVPGAPFTAKEHREHQIVLRDVVHALEPLVAEHPAQPKVMELTYVRHLHTPVRATTAAGFAFGALLARLFPTSAVAGAPRSAALDFIARHEGFDRGWYSGAVGRISKGDVDLAVALRCMLVRDRTATLFAGAGIVAGSEPQAEWDESARKTWPAARAWREATDAGR